MRSTRSAHLGARLHLQPPARFASSLSPGIPERRISKFNRVPELFTTLNHSQWRISASTGPCVIVKSSCTVWYNSDLRSHLTEALLTSSVMRLLFPRQTSGLPRVPFPQYLSRDESRCLSTLSNGRHSHHENHEVRRFRS